MQWDQVLLEKSLGHCPFPQKRKVWGSLPNTPGGILVVGEAPGRSEEEEGEPFVGKAGQLLRGILGRYPDQEFYYTNCVICRPGEGHHDLPPTPEQLSCCFSRLLLTVSLYKPKSILAVGRVAGTQLLGELYPGPGMAVESSFLGWACTVHCAYHPAYVLRKPSALAALEESIHRCLAMEQRHRRLFSPTTVGEEKRGSGAPLGKSSPKPPRVLLKWGEKWDSLLHAAYGLGFRARWHHSVGKSDWRFVHHEDKTEKTTKKDKKEDTRT